jgi:hypothetical protein
MTMIPIRGLFGAVRALFFAALLFGGAYLSMSTSSTPDDLGGSSATVGAYDLDADTVLAMVLPRPEPQLARFGCLPFVVPTPSDHPLLTGRDKLHLLWEVQNPSLRSRGPSSGELTPALYVATRLEGVRTQHRI